MHIHPVVFKTSARNARAPFDYEPRPEDVAYVGEGETMRMLMILDGTGAGT